jgi:hypothetical protein
VSEAVVTCRHSDSSSLTASYLATKIMSSDSLSPIPISDSQSADGGNLFSYCLIMTSKNRVDGRKIGNAVA